MSIFTKAFFIYLILTGIAFSHSGTSYPILVDRKISNTNLTIWADPDLSKGSFFIYLDGELKSEAIINIKANPTDDTNHILKSEAKLSNEKPERSTYIAILPFDRATNWNIEFSIILKNKNSAIISIPLEVIPPGPNKLEFAIYLLPFLLVGLILLRIIITKMKKV